MNTRNTSLANRLKDSFLMGFPKSRAIVICTPCSLRCFRLHNDLHFHDNLHVFNSNIHKILHTNMVTTANTAICAPPSGKISMDALLLTLLLQREPPPVQKRAKLSTQQLHPSGVRIVAGRGFFLQPTMGVGRTADQLFP